MTPTNEPVLYSGLIIALVQAFLVLLMSFGLSLSEDQSIAIMGFTTAAVAVLAAWIVRKKVTPVANPQS